MLAGVGVGVVVVVVVVEALASVGVLLLGRSVVFEDDDDWLVLLSGLAVVLDALPTSLLEERVEMREEELVGEVERIEEFGGDEEIREGLVGDEEGETLLRLVLRSLLGLPPSSFSHN